MKSLFGNDVFNPNQPGILLGRIIHDTLMQIAPLARMTAVVHGGDEFLLRRRRGKVEGVKTLMDLRERGEGIVGVCAGRSDIEEGGL